MTHTKEPWEYVEESFNIGHDITKTYNAIRSEGINIARMPSDKDAKRIVACVNACAGYTNEQLNSGAKLVPTLLHEDFRLLKQQRNELLAQIKNIYDCVFMADDNAAGQGYDADSSIRRHLGYAMAIANKAEAGVK